MNKRLGVSLKDNKNLETIFLYFAEPETAFLIYKKFCEDIFYFISTEDRNNRIKNINNNYKNEETFNEILTRKILDKKGPFTLLELVKNIKLIDYENCNIIFFNDFIRALKRTDITLEENEKLKIFEECDYYANKNLHYENMINILVNQFWSEENNDLCEEIFFSLTNNGKKCISINYIQKILKNLLGLNDFLNFIEKYKLIYKYNSLEPISLKDFTTLFKYFNFGEDKSDFLKELNLVIRQNSNDNGEIKNDKYAQLKQYFNNDKYNKTKNKKLHPSKSVAKINKKEININNKKSNLYQILSKIKNIFIEYGRLSLFNFIKQFKYYESNDNLINRNSFRKVFNNFNIKLTPEEIDLIFNELGVDYSKNYMYHEDFIKFLSVKMLNKKRDDIIKNIYDFLLEKRGIPGNDLNIQYLKDIYNPKNNYFIKNDEDNYLEFIDCLEIFHFCYKGFKSKNFSKKEFVEFYRLISFLVNDDNDFISLITNEWRVNKNFFENNFSFKDDNKNSYKKEENSFLIDLKNELVKRGVKGLLDIHYKFLTLCSNIEQITLDDFMKIMKLNLINFDADEFKDIFNYFSMNSNNKYLDYTFFIRFFKKELNETKLNIVEKIFLSLQYENANEDEDVPLNQIKNKYKAKNHPEVVSGIKTEKEKIKEFRECFDINYNIFNSRKCLDKNEKMVDFDMFANFYEYVSFIYEGDNEFVNLLVSTWC